MVVLSGDQEGSVHSTSIPHRPIEFSLFHSFIWLSFKIHGRNFSLLILFDFQTDVLAGHHVETLSSEGEIQANYPSEKRSS